MYSYCLYSFLQLHLICIYIYWDCFCTLHYTLFSDSSEIPVET